MEKVSRGESGKVSNGNPTFPPAHFLSSHPPEAGATLALVIRNIIFDWSGTLVDDLPAVFRATNFVFSQVGIDLLTLEKFRAEFCLPFKKFYDRYTPTVEMAQLEIWFHSHFRQVQHSVVELPHAREFLLFCREKSVRTFLLSTVHRDHYAVQERTTGLGGFIEKAYVEILDKRTKIHDILKENELSPHETMFIGDMQHDIETGKHGGVFSCAVLTGYNTLEQLRASEPDLIVHHLGELQTRLLETNFHLVPDAGLSEAGKAQHQTSFRPQ